MAPAPPFPFPLVALMMALANRLQTPELAFSISALACLGTSLLCAWFSESEADPTLEAVIRTVP